MTYGEFVKGIEGMGIHMFDNESKRLFDHLDKGKSGKLTYKDFTSCFTFNTLSKQDSRQAEMLFLAHPVEEIIRANSVSELSDRSTKLPIGVKTSEIPLNQIFSKKKPVKN